MAQRNYNDLFEPYETAMYADADQAITKTELWEWMGNYSPPRDMGWMFDDHPNIGIITSNMKMRDGHSGASMGITLRKMEYIAKNGWDKFVAEVKFRRNSR